MLAPAPRGFRRRALAETGDLAGTLVLASDGGAGAGGFGSSPLPGFAPPMVGGSMVSAVGSLDAGHPSSDLTSLGDKIPA
jgi:hypothetical protein